MRFDDSTNKLVIDKTVFLKLLSQTDVAAAFIHEAVYKTLRDEPADHTDSIRSRVIVGKMFSSFPLVDAVAQLPSMGVQRCKK